MISIRGRQHEEKCAAERRAELARSASQNMGQGSELDFPISGRKRSARGNERKGVSPRPTMGAMQDNTMLNLPQLQPSNTMLLSPGTRSNGMSFVRCTVIATLLTYMVS